MASDIEERLKKLEESRFVQVDGNTIKGIKEEFNKLGLRIALLEKLLKFNDTYYDSNRPRVQSIDLGSIIRKVTEEVLEDTKNTK